MTELTLYHNPRCSKSRGALELLEARGLTPEIVRYLETPPTAAHSVLCWTSWGSPPGNCCVQAKKSTKASTWPILNSAKQN